MMVLAGAIGALVGMFTMVIIDYFTKDDFYDEGYQAGWQAAYENIEETVEEMIKLEEKN